MISSVLQAARSESTGVRAYELLLDSRRRTSRGREAAAKRCEKQRSAALPCVGFEELSSNKKTPHADAERRRVHREKEADAARSRRGEHRKEEA